MGMELVTGYQGVVHVTAAQEADLYRGMYGDGILPVGNRMAIDVVSNTEVVVRDGVCLLDGREFYIGYGDKVSLPIATGNTGYCRNDIIVIQYTMDTDNDCHESAEFAVIQGTPSTTAVDPTYNDADIRTGVFSSQKPFARVRINGINIEGIDSLVSNAGNLIDTIYPVGSIYMSTSPTNPGEYLGGTWVAWGSGRVPVGVDSSDSDFSTVGKTGGSKTVTLTSPQIPSHTHSIPALSGTAASAGSHTHNIKYHENYAASGTSRNIIGREGENESSSSIVSAGAHTHSVTTNASTTGSNGSGSSHTNLQPYITCYMWNRTA